jgi:hypothetical protein
VADCAVAASPRDVRLFMSNLRAIEVTMRLLQSKVVLVSVVAASGLQIIASKSWNSQGDVMLAKRAWIGVRHVVEGFHATRAFVDAHMCSTRCCIHCLHSQSQRSTASSQIDAAMI